MNRRSSLPLLRPIPQKSKRTKTHHPVKQLCTIVTLSCSPLQALNNSKAEKTDEAWIRQETRALVED